MENKYLRQKTKVVLLCTNGVYSHKLTYDGIKQALEQIKQEDINFDFIEVNICEQDGPKIDNYKPDWVLVVSPLAAGFRIHLKRNKKVICFDTEGIYEKLAIDSLPYCHIMATVDKFGAEHYKQIVKEKRINCKIYHMPLGFSPDLFKFQNVGEEYKSDVCIIGVLFDRRRKVVEDLYPLKDKIRVRVITAKDWWNRLLHKDGILLHKDIVTPEEMVKYYCGAKIILCVNRDYSPGNPLGIKSSTPGRVFQEAACRRMVMLDNSRPEINDYFVDKKEIVLFDSSDNGDDLRQKVMYYLEHEEEREAIAHNGCVRTMNENTWKHRIQGLLKFANE